MSDSLQPLKRIVEGALLATGEALSVERLLELFEQEQRPEKNQILEALRAVQNDCLERGFELVEVASGWRFQVRSDLAPWINKLWEEKPQKYSRALLETLSLIAYRQPLTRSDIEEVRGVAVSSHIIKTLAEREWIRVVGHRDVPGRPSLYATTRQFLDYFGLKSLDELPALGELKDIDSLNAKLNLDSDEFDEIAEAKASSHDAEAQELAVPDDGTGNDALEQPTTTDREQIEMARDEALRETLTSSEAPELDEDQPLDAELTDENKPLL